MYEILKIEKDIKTKTIESLRTMLPYVIETAVLTALYRDVIISDKLNTIPYLATLIYLYGITYSHQFLRTYLKNEKNNFSKTLYK